MPDYFTGHCAKIFIHAPDYTALLPFVPRPRYDKYMQLVDNLITKFDGFQQKHGLIGFPLAVLRKFGDDRAGNQAALIAYYAFLSIFPLLLVAFTLIPVIVGHNGALEQRIINAALTYFPVIGGDLQHNIHTYHRSGIGLVIGLLFAFYGARGVANAIQDTSNAVWEVPRKRWPGFPWNMLRSFAIIIVGGGGLVFTTVALGLIAGLWHGNIVGKLVLFVIALLLNSVVFFGVFRLATAKQIPTANLLFGAILSAVFWQILQLVGSFLLLHQFKNASAIYGTFAVVLGLISWLYLQAELYVYALEINVVRHTKAWPKNLKNSK